MEVNYDFFQVEPVDGVTFGEALQNVNSLPIAAQKVDVRGRAYRISYLEKDKPTNFWTGDIVRVRMSNLPGIADLESEEIKDIDLEDNEGIGECACFGFSESDNVMVLQRSRFAIGPYLVGPLFRKLSQIDKAWTLAPVPRRDAIEKLNSAVEFKSVMVRFARVRAPELVVGKRDGDRKAVTVANQGIIPLFKIEMTNGHGKTKMNTAPLMAFAKRVFRMAGGVDSEDEEMEVDDIRIRAVDTAGDKIDLKMLDYQLSYSADASDTKSRRIPYSTRRLHVLDASRANMAIARHLLNGD